MVYWHFSQERESERCNCTVDFGDRGTGKGGMLYGVKNYRRLYDVRVRLEQFTLALPELRIPLNGLNNEAFYKISRIVFSSSYVGYS